MMVLLYTVVLQEVVVADHPGPTASVGPHAHIVTITSIEQALTS